MKVTKHIWALLGIFALSFLIFYPSLKYYFFQDDWFVLNWVKTGNLQSFLSFRTDIIYWRPLSMPLLFTIASKLFGLNPLGFHLLAMSIFLGLTAAVYKLFQLLFKSNKLALAAAALYGMWPIHFMSLSWFSTTSYIVGPLFQVLSFIFFIKFSKIRDLKLYILSLLLFLLGLASSEFAVVLPIIFLAWSYLYLKKLNLKLTLPFTMVASIYLILRFVAYPLPAKDGYTISLTPSVVTNFFWYIWWGLGLPESFKDLVFIRLPWQSLSILAQFWKISVPTALFSVVISWYVLGSLKKNSRNYLFGFVWILIGLSPVLILKNHSYSVYLSFAGLGLLFIILSSLKKAKNLILVILILLWITISLANLQFTRHTHWIQNEQAISKSYVTYILKNVEQPQKESVFVIRPADVTFSKENGIVLVETEKTLEQSLNMDNAIQVIFNDSSLKSIFLTHQQTINLSKDTNLYEISPRGTDK